MKRKDLTLVVAEYPDGRIAVQAIANRKEAEGLFDECNRADADLRMSLVCIDFQDGIVLSGKTKMVGRVALRKTDQKD